MVYHFERLRMLFMKLIGQIASIRASGEETDIQRGELEALKLTISSLEEERNFAELFIGGLLERDLAREGALAPED